MLASQLSPGAKLVGLSLILNSGRPGFTGHYRVVAVGGTKAIEFFGEGAAARGRPMLGGHRSHAIHYLPYRTDMISTMPVSAGAEVISGPFTGCVMSLFRYKNDVMAGHVDTNPSTSQRASYAARQKSGDYDVISEYDTAGKIPDNLTRMQVILCIADTNGISSFRVEPSTLMVSRPGASGGGLQSTTIFTVIKKI